MEVKIRGSISKFRQSLDDPQSLFYFRTTAVSRVRLLGKLMSWETVQIGNKTADLWCPKDPTHTRGGLLFLHGYDGVTLRDNESFTCSIEKHQLITLCPHGEHCWWSDAIYEPFDKERSPIEFLVDEVPSFFRTRFQIEPPRIGVCGVEMGGQGALQLSYRHARRFPTVVAISPKVDFESWWGHGTSLDEIFPDREAARQRTATLHIHPLNYPKNQLLMCDPADIYCFDGVVTLTSKLSSSGIPFDSDFISTHGGFGWNYANAMAERAVEYVASKLT
jgi:S-formylglutathione hydrolase